MADMAVRLASFVCLFAALPAAANVAASTRTPAAFTLSSGTARTRSAVLGEKLDFDCAEAERKAACRFEARYRLLNGTSEAEVIDAAFLGLRTREVSVQFDGEPLPVGAEQAGPLGSTSASREAAPTPSSPEEALGRLADTPVERFGFTLTLPPMARLGYQLAAPESFLHSLSVETDFREQLVLTPLTQDATPQVAIIPRLGLGLGLGVPVQVLPEARPGLRLLADLHFRSAGAALSWDHSPAQQEGMDSFSRLILQFEVGL